MSGTRRGLVVAGIGIAVLAGFFGITPAYASFADSVTGATTITTATVAPPETVTGSLTCNLWGSSMAVTWTSSSSTRVSGYLVTVYAGDGTKKTVQLGPAATTWTSSFSLFSYPTVQYSVTTQTDYGWTAESTKTGWFHC